MLTSLFNLNPWTRCLSRPSSTHKWTTLWDRRRRKSKIRKFLLLYSNKLKFKSHSKFHSNCCLNSSKCLFNNSKCRNSKWCSNNGHNSNLILTFNTCHRCLCQWWMAKVTWLKCKTLTMWWAIKIRCHLWITTLTWCTKILHCKEINLWLRNRTKRSLKDTSTISRWCSNQDKKERMC